MFFLTQVKQQIQTLQSTQKLLFWMIFIFSALGLIGIFNHAMWRDELNVWLIVRDSTSWTDYIHNIRYEGHPLLWYLSLSFWHLFTDNPVIMQLWHWGLGIAIIILFWQYSPFLRWQKVCFTFSYYPFYEYFLISRNYALGILGLFGVCTLFPSRRKTYFPLAVTLALMANTNAYALLIAFGLVVMLVVEAVGDRISNHELSHIKFWDSVLSLLIVGLGFAIAVYILRPPPDSYLQGGISDWNFVWSWEHFWRSLSRIWSAYAIVLIPADSRVFDTNLFGVISLGIVTFVTLGLWRKHLPLLFYLFASGEIVFFTYVKFLGSPRHYGHLWFVLLAALWLSAHDVPRRDPFPLIKRFSLESHFSHAKKLTLGLFLVMQLVGGLVAYGRDWTYPFSAGRAAAQYLQTHQLDQGFLMGSQDLAMAPLSGYLNRKLYYPERQAWGSFTLFNHERREVDAAEILRQAQEILQTQASEIILIRNSELDLDSQNLRIEPLQSFTRGLIYNEKYYVYRLTPQR